MSVMASRYRSPHISERLLPPHPVHGQTGCLIASTWGATAYASLGESTILPDGRLKGRAAMAADLHRMLLATGEPDRAGYNPSHVPSMTAALGYPAPASFSGSFEDMWADTAAAFTIAGNVKTMPGTALHSLAVARSWSTADHELLLTPHRRRRAGAQQALLLDPMRPMGGRYRGDWIPMSEVRAFTKPFDLVAMRYRVGAWTAAAEWKERLTVTVDKWAVTRTQLRAERARAAELDLELTECRKDTDGSAAAGRAQVLDALKDWITEQEAA